MPVLVFVTYTKMGNTLTASTAFTTLSLFGIIRGPFAFLPMVIQQIVNSKVSLDRIRNFLLSDEMKPGTITPPDDPDDSLHLNHLTASWGAPKPSADAMSSTVPTHAHGHGHGGGGGHGHGHGASGNGAAARRKPSKQGSAKGAAGAPPGDLTRADSTTHKWQRTATAGRGAASRGPVLELASIDEKPSGGPSSGGAGAPAADTDEENQHVFRLHDVELRVKKGQLVAVVGPIG